MATNQIIGAEALVRWYHPLFGFVLPTDFIGLAEVSGLIKPLTMWVLDEASNQCGKWHANGWEFDVAINLSASHLHDRDLLDFIQQYLDKKELKTDWLILEFTESMIMHDPAHAIDAIRKLYAFGFRIAIDDFGTGHSSLTYLKDLPADELKIDQSFVFNINESKSNRLIVESTINLAHNLGLKVTAEGIETEEVFGKLVELGCDTGQGTYFSNPLPVEEFDEWLASSDWSSSLKAGSQS